MKSFLILFILFSSHLSFAETGNLEAFWRHHQGGQQLIDKKYNESVESYTESLTADPGASPSHNNLGIAFEGTGQLKKAQQSYNTAERTAKSKLEKFAALFNQAQAYAKDKQIDLALAYYQKALEIDPRSQEIKTNIELLIQSNSQGGQGQQDQPQDPKDQEGKDQKQPQQYAPNQKQKYQPQNLSEGDVKKILEELKNQEKKIRADFEKKQNSKDQGNDKDW